MISFFFGIIVGGWVEQTKLNTYGAVAYLQNSWITLVLFSSMLVLLLIFYPQVVWSLEMYCFGVFVMMMINIEKIHQEWKEERKE